jgi:6-pyruvoyl tetrahydropterin synthase/QueD family protein
MVYLTRKAEFSASHYYHNPDFTPEENRRIFGKCNNPNGHGHNYTLEVTVKGEVDPRSGFVVDLKQLKEIMHREVLDAMDHRQRSPRILHPDSNHRKPRHRLLAAPGIETAKSKTAPREGLRNPRPLRRFLWRILT